jgi:type IV pilus assembly protein PilE
MKHSKGFTLIELMIVVAIIGILSSIAFGFFGDNVIAANRSEGRAELTATAASLEKCRSLYGAYNAGGCNVTGPTTGSGRCV